MPAFDFDVSLVHSQMSLKARSLSSAFFAVARNPYKIFTDIDY